MIPGTIGKYQIERRLGDGGMAEVFLARLVGAEGFTLKVAIKRIRPGVASNSSFASLFVGEARISAQLHHPNIISILDFDRDPEHGLYLVMELVEGRDLAQVLEAGPLPVSLTLHILAEVLRGLGHAHSPPEGELDARGVVHRDVSPHNVLLSWEGAVKVSDFGIAKSRVASYATASEFIKGKPTYMSPEQANGESLDGRSDLFAVGVMLWEMLVGRSLFGRKTLQETLAAVFSVPIPSPSSCHPAVPEEVSLIAMRLLERDRTQRYATAEEARRALLACGDAPRDGRAELIELLQARFGGRAADRARAPTLLSGASLPLAAASPPPLSLGTPQPSAVSAGPPLRSRASWRLGLIFVGVALLAGTVSAGVVALAGGRSNAPDAPGSSVPRGDSPGASARSSASADQTAASAALPVADAQIIVEPDSGKGAPVSTSAPSFPTDRASEGAGSLRSGRADPAHHRAKKPASPDTAPSGIVDLRVE